MSDAAPARRPLTRRARGATVVPVRVAHPPSGQEGGRQAGEVGDVVKRQSVVSERGRRWLAGRLTSQEYFDAERAEALRRARATVAARLTKARGTRHA